MRALGYLAFLDLALAAILVHMVWQLQMKLRKKVAICILLSTGVMSVISRPKDTTHADRDPLLARLYSPW